MKKLCILCTSLLLLLSGCGTETADNKLNNSTESAVTESDTEEDIKYETNLGNIYDNLCQVIQDNNLQWNISNVRKSETKGSDIINYYISINDFSINYSGYADEDYTIDIDTNKYMEFSPNMPYLIMAFDSSCTLEQANEISNTLIDTYDENSSSDVINLNGYCVYLKPDTIDAAFYDSVINVVFSPYTNTLSNINVSEYSELSVEQMLNPIYAGQKVKTTASVTSASRVGKVELYSFETTTDLGEKISFTYTMSSVPHKFSIGEKYNFYSTITSTETTDTPKLRLIAIGDINGEGQEVSDNPNYYSDDWITMEYDKSLLDIYNESDANDDLNYTLILYKTTSDFQNGFNYNLYSYLFVLSMEVEENGEYLQYMPERIAEVINTAFETDEIKESDIVDMSCDKILSDGRHIRTDILQSDSKKVCLSMYTIPSNENAEIKQAIENAYDSIVYIKE